MRKIMTYAISFSLIAILTSSLYANDTIDTDQETDNQSELTTTRSDDHDEDIWDNGEFDDEEDDYLLYDDYDDYYDFDDEGDNYDD